MGRKDVNIGEITGEWDYSTLPKNVRIGADCFIERKYSFERFRSTRDPGLVMGDRVRIYTWTTFNIEPSGLLEIGDDSALVGAIFMCADRIRIGRRVIVSYNVTIADCDFHPLDPDERQRDAIANAPFSDRKHRAALLTRAVEIGDDVSIGIGAIVLKGSRIGDGAKVLAGAVVAGEVSAGVTVAGNPARVIDPEALR